ncbi:Uncharacterised protein [Chlamydia trachomatis]|nr:Uncharacterised protein [Chlamydia trachomatis]
MMVPSSISVLAGLMIWQLSSVMDFKFLIEPVLPCTFTLALLKSRSPGNPLSEVKPFSLLLISRLGPSSIVSVLLLMMIAEL